LKKLLRGIVRRKGGFWLNIQKNNKRQWFNLHTTDEQQAIRVAADIRSNPDLIKNGDSLSVVADRFVADMRLIRERGSRDVWSDLTCKTKIYRLRNFAAFCVDKQPDQITADDIKRYYNRRLRETGAATAHGSYMTIRSFFHWCVEQRLARKNPCMEIKVEKPA